jgi:hypothetical protein
MTSRIRSIAAATVLTAALAVPLPAGTPVAAETAGWTALEPAPEPESNPLKGFIPFQGDYDTFPHSMEWAYFPVNAVMTGPDTFDWSVFDQALEDIAGRGHQTALRFYLDYPTRPTGIPRYLLDGGLETRTYDDYGNAGVSVSPDYDDPALRAAIEDFVAALGARYDGDPRVGFVQAGLVGFWGEWLTYPFNGLDGNADWMASEATQQEILTDFVDAFDETELEVRNPDAVNAPMPIGYHDDSFALSTKTSSLGWHFMDNMVSVGATEKWREYSIGGELRPELQSCIFSAAGCDEVEEGGDYDFAGSVEQTHASWLMNHYAFQTGYSSADLPAALDASRSLGYSFSATEALLRPSEDGVATEVGVTVENTGVAPFYYDWPIDVALADAAGSIVRTARTEWLLSDVASGSNRRFTTVMDTSGLARGHYTVLAQVVNPLATGQPLRFANAGQDADLDGWLTLGSTRVGAEEATVPATPEESGPPVSGGAAAGPTAPTRVSTSAGSASVVPPRTSPRTLAATGGDASGLVGAAVVLLGAGIAFSTTRRMIRRRPE